MRIRAAAAEDAPSLGCVMVESWLSAHRGQIPEAAWQRRVAEWTPEVSSRGWAGLLLARADGSAPRDVLLVAEGDAGAIDGLVHGSRAVDDITGAVASILSLYVATDRRGRGIGASLLRTAASELAALGFGRLRVDVLTANHAGRGFYEALGGHEAGQGTFDEDGHPLPVTVYEWSDIGVLSRD